MRCGRRPMSTITLAMVLGLQDLLHRARADDSGPRGLMVRPQPSGVFEDGLTQRRHILGDSKQ